MAMMRFYIQKGTHKGLYRSIARTLKFFQTFALVEVRTISTLSSYKEPSWCDAVIEGPNKGTCFTVTVIMPLIVLQSFSHKCSCIYIV